jgi:predicted CoA-binding protein
MNRDDEAAAIGRMLQARRIAVVGLSDDPSRPSFRVASYLQSQGIEIVPVNPHGFIILGVHCLPSLAKVQGPIDVVDVFRRPEFCPEIVREAIAAGAKGVWIQSGIRSEGAQRLATEAGIDFVQDRCLMVEHMRSSHR